MKKLAVKPKPTPKKRGASPPEALFAGMDLTTFGSSWRTMCRSRRKASRT